MNEQLTTRINARISLEMNDWLDAESTRTGIPKGSLVFLAVEQYKAQKDALTAMTDLAEITKALDGFAKQVNARFDALEEKHDE